MDIRNISPKSTPITHRRHHVYRDAAEWVIPLKLKTILTTLGILIGLVATAVYGYVDLRRDVTSVKCDMRQLVDVVIYQKEPRQPDCK